MANDLKAVRQALASALATYQISDEVINKAADKLATLPHPIRGIDVCIYGICLDLLIDGRDWRAALKGLLDVEDPGWRKFDILTYGIPVPDFAHIRLGQPFEGIPSLPGRP